MRLLAILFAATTALAADDTIDCTGLWSPQTSEQALATKFGKANVKREAVHVAEGSEEDGTVLFPNDPKRRVEIVWKNKKGRKSPEWLRISDESRWSVFGLRNGMTLAEVEKRNGRGFRLSGFDWDYGGIVTDWRGGAIATLGGKACRVALELTPLYPENPTKAEQKAMDAVVGDREISSTSPHLKKLKVHVRELTVMY